MTRHPVVPAVKEFFSLRNNIEVAFLRMAQLLKSIRDEKLYEGQYENFDSFLLEARMSKASASKLINVYETFVEKYKVPHEKLAAVGWSTLYEIQRKLPEDTERDKVLEWVDKGAMLTRDDTKRELANMDGSQTRCRHTNCIMLRKCVDCGFVERAND